MKEFMYTVKDEQGIHARPAGMLAKEAKKYESKITIYKDEKSALILDAKYKNAWSDAVQNKNGNFDERVREDYFQILA